MTINLRTPGIILGTERFDDCVAFYHETIGLPLWFRKDGLVCLRFGDGYLMLEHGGVAVEGRKSNAQNPTMIRFNVEDVRADANKLREKGVGVTVTDHDWGTVATFLDPDGNACELKDSSDPFFMGEA